MKRVATTKTGTKAVVRNPPMACRWLCRFGLLLRTLLLRRRFGLLLRALLLRRRFGLLLRTLLLRRRLSRLLRALLRRRRLGLLLLLLWLLLLCVTRSNGSRKQ